MKRICIVGAGPAGIFAGMVFKNIPGIDVTVIELGKPVEERMCPKETTGYCMKCPVCNVTCGLAGGGAGSDGKVLKTKGGNLTAKIGESKADILLGYAYQIYTDFAELAGISPKIYGEKDTDYILELEEKAKELGMRLEHPPIMHLGTEGAKRLFYQLQEHLKEKGIKFIFNARVFDVDMSGDIKTVKYKKDGSVYNLDVDIVLFAPGRYGADWLSDLFKRNNISSEYSKIIFGVRAELPDEPVKKANRDAYEPKFRMIGDGVFIKGMKTFCQCPSGMIANENYGDNGIAVNGHSFAFKKTNV